MKENSYESAYKAYVTVQAKFYPDGRPPVPMEIWWEDGRHYEVDKIIDVRRAASLKAGGLGLRYRCQICGRAVDLFYEDESARWFMERKEPKCAEDIS